MARQWLSWCQGLGPRSGRRRQGPVLCQPRPVQITGGILRIRSELDLREFELAVLPTCHDVVDCLVRPVLGLHLDPIVQVPVAEKRDEHLNGDQVLVLEPAPRDSGLLEVVTVGKRHYVHAVIRRAVGANRDGPSVRDSTRTPLTPSGRAGTCGWEVGRGSVARGRRIVGFLGSPPVVWHAVSARRPVVTRGICEGPVAGRSETRTGQRWARWRQAGRPDARSMDMVNAGCGCGCRRAAVGSPC